jgi:hypothetical protein
MDKALYFSKCWNQFSVLFSFLLFNDFVYTHGTNIYKVWIMNPPLSLTNMVPWQCMVGVSCFFEVHWFISHLRSVTFLILARHSFCHFGWQAFSAEPPSYSSYFRKTVIAEFNLVSTKEYRNLKVRTLALKGHRNSWRLRPHG